MILSKPVHAGWIFKAQDGANILGLYLLLPIASCAMLSAGEYLTRACLALVAAFRVFLSTPI